MIHEDDRKIDKCIISTCDIQWERERETDRADPAMLTRKQASQPRWTSQECKGHFTSLTLTD
jgi:hypothetical protein